MQPSGAELHAIEREEAAELLRAGTPASLVEGRRILVLTPDGTRSCPLPMLVRAVHDAFGGRAAALDFMVAVGTHTPLEEPEILRLYGISPAERAAFGSTRFLCHRWDVPGTLERIGWLEKPLVEELSEGRLSERVPVDLNRAVGEHDLVLILGPVFPHEVAGFSGGAKYLYPGISGGELLHFFHWLGAVITNARIIGRKDTPVRRVIHAAMARVTRPVHCAALVVDGHAALRGMFVGGAVEAWSKAADLSARLHVREFPRPFHTVLGQAAPLYDELWTAGKVMYKLEQVVADGGELIIHAPRVREVSRTWGAEIERIGYHVRDYFLAQPERFAGVPRGVLAHSTHVRGTGTYLHGQERPRIRVTLATGIPADVCARINLGYADPASIDVERFRGRESEGILFVPEAGEVLYRLAT